MIVFVYHRVPLLIHAIIGPLLFSPHTLLGLDDLLSLLSIHHCGAVALNLLATRSVSLLNHVQLVLMLLYVTTVEG